MSKVINYTGKDIQDRTYYSIQKGLIISVAFYNDGVWYIPAENPVNERDLKKEIIVIEEICKHDDISKETVELPLVNGTYYAIFQGLIAYVAYYDDAKWYIPGVSGDVAHDDSASSNIVVLKKVCTHNDLIKKE